MNSRAATFLATLAALVALVMVGGSDPAVAARSSSASAKNFKYVINLAGRQRMLTQMMSKEAVLVALGINKPENLANLQQNHQFFEQVLKGLRHGDINLALAGTSNSTILEELSKVEELWPLVDNAMQETVASGGVSRKQVDTIADLNLPLLQAMDRTVKAYEKIAAQGGLFSMLDKSIEASGLLRMLSQKMSKEFFLIAYGHEVDQNKNKLSQTIDQFDRVLNGLLNGDFELLLLPAPTVETRTQLRSVQEQWTKFRPLVRGGLREGKVDAETVRSVEQMNVNLLQEAHRAVAMFEAL